MYQWVISTLLVAVITIITTILTVKSTMRGYIISPQAKGKLTSKARRYSFVILESFLLLWALFWLIYNAQDDGKPITRGLVVALSFYSCMVVLSGLLLMIGIGWIYVTRGLTAQDKTISD